MKHLTAVLIGILIVAAGVPGLCQQPATQTTAATILKNPEDWVNRRVILNGSITNLQPSLDISTYKLRDAESVISVRTERTPQRQEFIEPVSVTGEVRIDTATSQPYIWEQSRGPAGGDIPPLLYVLIGSGVLLIVLAIVLAVMLTRKSEAEPEQVEAAEGAHIGDTVEVDGAAGGMQVAQEHGGGASPLAQTQQFRASLSVVDGPDAGKGATPLTKSVTTIGRAPDRDIQLTDPTVSRKHARITAHDDGRLVLTNESTKGTLVNGNSIDGHTLSDGDRIQVGSTTLEAKVAGAAAGTSASAAAPTQEFVPDAERQQADEGLAATSEFLGAELEVVSGPASGDSHVLMSNVTSIGRSPDNDWTISDDPTISRQHCQIHHDSGTFTVVAAPDDGEGHKNVLVNGDQVVTAEIQQGDEIRLGGTKIAFKQI